MTNTLPKISLPWDEIDTVLLDMDGTLLDLHFDNYFWLEYLPRFLANKNQRLLDECRVDLQQQSEEVKGSLNWYCLDYWSELLSIDIPKLKLQVSHKIAFRPQAIEFLQSLKRRKKQIVLATNAHPKALELKLIRADFRRFFSVMSSSHEIGFPKEQAKYWPLLMEQYGFQPQRCLFIDDSFSVLKAAENAGIGFILAIEQPDSTKSSIDCSPFTGISNFSQLI
ncbi:MAG: GMP/IMP nucleotidase [Kangiellaceae bacterium]|nr:GMP/IMP nucleotidase [Kangiellaceae bacterium]